MRYVRYALVLLLIALVGPGAAGAFAARPGPPEKQVSARPPSSRVPANAVASAPADASVHDIQFALERGDNARPVAPSNSFKFGIKHVWAFWAWDDARDGDHVEYFLRFGSSDVSSGILETDHEDGRMEVELRRADGDYMMIGTYTLTLVPSGRNAETRTAMFEIYDDTSDGDNGNNNNNNNSDDNGNDNSENSNSNNNNNNDNFDGDNGNDNVDGDNGNINDNNDGDDNGNDNG